MSSPDKRLRDIVFDPEDDYEKIREFMGSVHYIQNGVKFSSGFKPVKILQFIEPAEKNIDNMTKKELREALALSRKALHPDTTVPQTEFTPKPKLEPEVKAPLTARDRAAEKLSGFKPSEKPDFVAQALAENAAAKQAEILEI